MNHLFHATLLAALVYLQPMPAVPDRAPDRATKEPLPAQSLPASTASTPEPMPSPAPPAGSTLYHTLTGRDAQVVFTSDAPIERIVGKSNAVVGYVIPGPSERPAHLKQAQWLLPVRSLATGIPLRDDHLTGKRWLDADSFPNIQYRLTGVDDVKEIKRGDGFSTWSVTLAGEMTIHGTTRTLLVKDARLTFVKESSKTASIAPGNLLFLKCDYSVKLSEFGIRNDDVPQKVADVVTISQTLRLTTALPEPAKSTQPQAPVTERPNTPKPTEAGGPEAPKP